MNSNRAQFLMLLICITVIGIQRHEVNRTIASVTSQERVSSQPRLPILTSIHAIHDAPRVPVLGSNRPAEELEAAQVGHVPFRPWDDAQKARVVNQLEQKIESDMRYSAHLNRQDITGLSECAVMQAAHSITEQAFKSEIAEAGSESNKFFMFCAVKSAAQKRAEKNAAKALGDESNLQVQVPAEQGATENPALPQENADDKSLESQTSEA